MIETLKLTEEDEGDFEQFDQFLSYDDKWENSDDRYFHKHFIIKKLNCSAKSYNYFIVESRNSGEHYQFRSKK